MNQADFLNDLNEAQKEAVVYTDGPQLVIAGAGSGKTRVLTYKIAYLLTIGMKPWEIMALTFTNKAAKEMKERIGKLVGDETARYLRMGTFHSVFAQILRQEAGSIGYNRDFTIYDEADSRSLCKSIIKEMLLDDKVYKPAAVHARISEAKNMLVTAQLYSESKEIRSADTDNKMPQIHSIYAEYQRRCRISNAMDFDDLLLNTYLLFHDFPDISKKYSERLRYFLVDEYQDTNQAQQQIITLLTTTHQNICVVGDDAQSIYAFRGANIDHILDFQQQFVNTRLFKLERNYRSTQNIVEAANSLIKKNARQIEKNVFSLEEQGERIRLTELSSDREEALFIAKDIRLCMQQEQRPYSDFAILYRTNYQSRTFEEQFIKNALPYRIYGGMSFYQRKEIKDITAYLRLVINNYDEEALRRIINYPTRGIGDTTLKKLLDAARTGNKTLWQVISEADHASVGIAKATQGKLATFHAMIEGFTKRLLTDDAYTLGKDIIKQSGISLDIYSDNNPENASRQEHLEEFLSSMQEFVDIQREQGEPTGLADFMHEISLLSDRDDADDDTPKVTLMTIHSAKGLEFPCVYVVGLEENIFPSPLSSTTMRGLEEERRLLYVAITRAQTHCHLTYAKMRFHYGRQEWQSPSRFIRDIDPTLISCNNSTAPRTNRDVFADREKIAKIKATIFGSKHIGMTPVSKVSTTESATSALPLSNPFSIGDNVEHERFGKGTITAIEGSGQSQKVTVRFDNSGTKTLLLKFAKLKKIL